MNSSAASRTTPSRRSFCARRRFFWRARIADTRDADRAAAGIALALAAGAALWALIVWLVVSGAASALWPVAVIVAGAIAARLAVVRRRALVASSAAALRPRNWDHAPTEAAPTGTAAARPVADVVR